jgi:hypothetical protein
MVKKKKSKGEEKIEKTSVHGTIDSTVIVNNSTTNNDDDDEDDEDEEFEYADMEKREHKNDNNTDDNEYKKGPIKDDQLKTYIEVLNKLCIEDRIEQFVKVFIPPDCSEDDCKYFTESLRDSKTARWEQMKREIEILQKEKYIGILGSQRNGPCEFRFVMPDNNNNNNHQQRHDDDDDGVGKGLGNNNNSAAQAQGKKKSSLQIVREVVFVKTQGRWHAEG